VAAVQPVSQAQPNDRGLEGWARALFDGIDDALFVHDLAGNIIEANPAACQRLGYTHEEMLRLTTRDIDDPSFAAGFEDRLAHQMNRGQFRCEGRHRAKDGRIIAVDINTAAIQVNGKPAVLAVMRDITQRQAMEDALRRQTALLQSILDNMGDAVIVADETGKFLVCNPAAQRLFGLSADAKGFPPQGADFCMYLPDRVTPYPADQLPLARAIRGETIDEVEVFLRRAETPQGRWLSVAGRPLAGGTGPRGSILVYRDISGRKRAEDRRNTQYAVTRALDECADLERAGPLILRYICEGLGWDVGALWLVDARANVLRSKSIWHDPNLKVQAFVDATRQAALAPGHGLPGRVWNTQHSLFIPDVSADANFPRAVQARLTGLKSGFAFPIRSGGETVGVIESFHRRMEKPDAELQAMMATMGSQIGQVHERQRVEKALRESEAFYHSLVESLPQNIFRKDREGRITFGNQRYVATLGSTLLELLGKTDLDLFPAHLAKKYRDDDQRVMDSGKILEAVEEHRLPDGTKLYVQVIKTPIFDKTGAVIGTQGVFWDVTERKNAEEAIAESERRYRQLTEATQDAIVVADHESRVTLFNPAAERMFGYAAAEVVGQNLELLLPEQYRTKHRQGFRRYLATRQSKVIGRPIEMHGQRKDGTIFPLELALSAIDVGDQMRFLGAIRDLTERNRIRAMLVQNEKLASIGLLSAGVAHEINNPLAFVANNLAVLERDNKGLMQVLTVYENLLPKLAQVAPEEAAQAAELAEQIDLPYIRENLGRLLTRTRDGVDRVTRIVQSLRGLARTDSPRRQETNLADLVDNSLEIIRGRLKRNSVEVRTCYDPNSKLYCVQTQINQVILNLLVNAQQAIEAADRPDGGRLTVSTKRLADEMMIEVSDTGCGIDPADLPKVFDPFFTTKDVGEGTGLGLSIAHNIIRGHGGRIEVDSKAGAGTTFRVYLPLESA
jgi:two-component system NtrC family sensor kinase